MLYALETNVYSFPASVLPPLQVNPSSLDLDHAHIQITHVEPFFSAKELEERRTKFERGNRISRFVFETPYTKDGRTHGDVTKHCMRKTILTSKFGRGGFTCLVRVMIVLLWKLL